MCRFGFDLSFKLVKFIDSDMQYQGQAKLVGSNNKLSYKLITTRNSIDNMRLDEPCIIY